MKLKDKTVLVTGASRGLGQVLAVAFAREGARLVICARDGDRLARTGEMVREAGGEVVATAGDVSVGSNAQAIVSAGLARFGRIDVLVNNAAVFPGHGGLDRTAPEDFDHTLAVNVRGPFLMTRAVLPQMKRNAYGRIVNVTSGLSVSNLAGYGPYNVSKAALNSLTRTLAEDLKGTGILVNGLDPGVFHSDMNPEVSSSPEKVVPDAILLATFPADGPTGRFFRRGKDLGW